MNASALIRSATLLLPSRSWTVLLTVSVVIGLLVALAVPVHVH